GLLRVLGLGNDASRGSFAHFVGSGFTHQPHGGGTVRDGRCIGGSDSAVFLERGPERGDFFGHGLAGRLVSVNDGVALATGYGNWCDFPFEAAVFGGGTRAAQRFERECVLRFTAEVVLVGTGFGKHAHGCPALVGVFEAVECHVVVHGGMAIAVALASTQQQVGCIAHAFLATSHDDI